MGARPSPRLPRLRLPDPASQEPVEHQPLLGLLACPGGIGRYVVAEILPLIDSDTATLRCCYSDVGEWVQKSMRYPRSCVSRDWKGKKDIVLSGIHMSDPLNGRKRTE